MAVLNPEKLLGFMTDKMKGLGTDACPPYHLAFVVGGTSPEANLKTTKLASTGYLDNLPGTGSEQGRAFRDKGLEEKLLKASQELGIGAQFGGKYFCLDIRVIRLPRHGASCLIGGAAARLGKECVTKVETIDYPELGMESLSMITVKDFPAFIIIDDKGNDFYEMLLYPPA